MIDLRARLEGPLAGRYQLGDAIGRGGSGFVFRARDLRHPRNVAIKVLDPVVSSLLGRERFEREIAVHFSLEHPHIVPVYESGEADGLLFYVMRLVDGPSLADRLGDGPVTYTEATGILQDVASALDFAHRRGVLHRDVKPANILLAEGGALLADFGIAKLKEETGRLTLTREGAVIGTPAYMSPEQCRGTTLGPETDIYSLGCVSYEMLVGSPPFVADSVEMMIFHHLNTPPPNPRQLRHELPARTTECIRRALAKNPKDRFHSAGSFASAFVRQGIALFFPAFGPGTAIAGTIGLGALVLALVLGPRFFASPPRSAWMLVADFESRGADTTMVDAIEDLVRTGLEDSDSLRVVSHERARQSAALADKPNDIVITTELAREVAVHHDIPYVVGGQIDRLGDGYSLIVRVMRAADGRPLGKPLREFAASPAQLFAAADRISRGVRRSLGERSLGLKSPASKMTGSIEAYQYFVHARMLAQAGDEEASLRYYRAARSLDEEFAAAWEDEGIALDNLGRADSARTAFAEASRLAYRLPSNYRHTLDARLALLNGDLEAGIRACREQLADDPSDYFALHRLGGYLSQAGRYREALEMTRRAALATPVAPFEATLTNEFVALVELDSLASAVSVASTMREPRRSLASISLRLLGGEWASAESLASSHLRDPASRPWSRAVALLSRAGVRANGNRLREAGADLDTAASLAYGAARTDVLAIVDAARLVLRRGLAARNPHRSEETPPLDASIAGWVCYGLERLADEDTAQARRALTEIARYPERDRRQEPAGPRLLGGALALSTGDPAAAVRILGTAPRVGSREGEFVSQMGKTAMRMILADAYRAIGNADSAAFYDRLAVQPTAGFKTYEAGVFGIARPFALRASSSEAEAAGRNGHAGRTLQSSPASAF